MNGEVAMSLKLPSLLRLGACLALALAGQQARSAIILQGPQVIERASEGGKPVVPKPRDAQDERSAVADPAYSDTLRFLNGDTLHGNLVGIDAEKSIRWRTPDAKGEIEFTQGKLAKILVNRSSKAPTGTNKVQAVLVRLTNGDEMVGELESLDGENLVVNTVFAGTMTFPRKYVQGLRLVSAAPNSLFEGPTGMDGWIARNKGSWRYVDGGFVTTKPGAIGRDLKLPVMARIEFDVAWRAQLQLMVHFYTDGFEEAYGANNAYMLQMSQGYMFMQRMRKNMGGNNIGQIEVQNLFAKRKVHVELLCNKEAKTIALLLDGSVAKQFKEPMEWVGSGTGLLFTMQGMGWHRVSNLRVSEWDGKIEEHGTTNTKSKEDMMEMSNHDRVTGALQSIKDGKLNFATAFANMEIPVDRMFNVDLAANKAEYPLKKFTDVKGLFVGRGSLTFAVDKYDGQQLVVSSPNFGQAKFAAAAFNQFVFNLEAQAKAALEDFDLEDDTLKQ
jgi:hypothetical protein